VTITGEKAGADKSMPALQFTLPILDNDVVGQALPVAAILPTGTTCAGREEIPALQ